MNFNSLSIETQAINDDLQNIDQQDEAEEQPIIKIINEPAIPIYHSQPKQKKTVILAGIFGLVIGGIIATSIKH
ncbi:hypothetical protein ACFLZA_00475 [Candidatus Neomarinimicrobiota bacterium]